MILSDVLGRVVTPSGEIESGIITALIGAPIFVYIIKNVRVGEL